MKRTLIAAALAAAAVFTTTPSADAAPSAKPAGSSTSWSYLTPGVSMRWNPCAPITYTYHGTLTNRVGSDMQRALSRVASASGLRFVAVTEGGALDIRWSDPSRDAFLASGEYSGYALTLPGPDPQWIESASIVLDLNTRYGQRMQRRAIMIHEVAHAVGLGHVADASQLMAPDLGTREKLGAGDLAGLAAVGAAGGC